MRVRLGSPRRGDWARGGTAGAGSIGGAHARPVPALRLPAAYDLLDVPAAAGHRVLLQLERLGTPLGPVLTVPAAGTGHEAGPANPGRGGRSRAHRHETGREHGDGSRLRFFVEAGTTASFLADLKDLGWDPADTDIRTIGVVLAAETPLPAADSPRWVRPPETVVDVAFEGPGGWPGARGAVVPQAVLPPARLLLGSLAYACRRGEQRRFLFAGSRAESRAG